jgi:putative glutamine amidotransferase
MGSMTATKPTIGIPQCLDESGRIRSGRRYLYIDIAYSREIERAGGIPLHLPLQRDLDALVSKLDGLLLPGGDDFLPETPYPADISFDATPDAQIEFDRALLGCAIDRGLPLLGICYGAQLIALHYGGSLHHHIPLDVADAGDHQLPEADGRHIVEIEENSLLASSLATLRTEVNSLHHQAIAQPGEAFTICARSPDGVIEAIERREGPFCLGVQWHPEKLADAPSRSLFSAFVSAAGKPGR